MKLNRGVVRVCLRLALALTAAGLSAACSGSTGLTGETAFVAPEKVRLKSSTAEAARVVGELKSGDEVTISDRVQEGNTAWAQVSGPGGQSGWVETRNLVKQDVVERARKIAEEIRTVPTQAVGKAKASLKLRLTPDRTGEENVALLLSAGTAVEIVARERNLRPDKLDAKPAATPANAKEAAEAAKPKFDEWYKVRLTNSSVVPAGWIYGGSVDLEIPPEISFFASTGRRMVGWQKLGTAKDEQGRSGDHFLVLERKLFDADEAVDFDRVKVLAYDLRSRGYTTPFRDEVAGKFPLTLKMEGSQGQFNVPAQLAGGPSYPVDYKVELLEQGRVKVTRLTPKRK